MWGAQPISVHINNPRQQADATNQQKRSQEETVQRLSTGGGRGSTAHSETQNWCGRSFVGLSRKQSLCTGLGISSSEEREIAGSREQMGRNQQAAPRGPGDPSSLPSPQLGSRLCEPYWGGWKIQEGCWFPVVSLLQWNA